MTRPVPGMDRWPKPGAGSYFSRFHIMIRATLIRNRERGTGDAAWGAAIPLNPLAAAIDTALSGGKLLDYVHY